MYVIVSSSKIQQLFKEPSLVSHWKKLNKPKEVYQSLVKLISNHSELLFSQKVGDCGPLLLKYPEELAQAPVKIQLKNLSNKLRSSYD